MAWQLIYTSAPRLLEAGRSGFGSVARHRQISPLLVSAIERASQFSRQPGMDQGRVIFSHRVIPISGGRFHVLSCIRDSGADYTGRTNHIAHHVVAESRELAQLGSQGVSPADVLLAMPWLAKWDDPPHYFEAADEVRLADFTPQTGADGAHWEPVTGSAAHAWLLAAGEASRGAYIIPPPGVDLRWLFADSLRLAPERLWQTTFTTSLQSRDEISDFRWIGLDNDSPLRNETGASGRVILDLTQPHLLPAPEAPAKTAPNLPAASAPKSEIPITVGHDVEVAPSAPVTYSYRPITVTSGPVSPRQSSPALVNLPSLAPSAKTRRFPVWIIWTLAAILLAATLIFAVFLPWRHLTDLRGKLVAILKWSEYFPDQSLDSIALKLLPDSSAWPAAEERAQAVNRIATALMRGQLETIAPEDEKQLRSLIADGAAPPPPEITHLQGLLDTAKEKSLWKPALKSASEAPQLQRTASDDINTVIPAPPYEKLNRALRTLSDQRIAEAEYELLARDSSIQPPESLGVFKNSLSQLKARMAGNEQALASIEKAGAIVALWELTESSSGRSGPEKIAAIKKRDGENAAKWPPWLLKKVSLLLNSYEDKFASKTAPGARTPPSVPSVPLYVVADLASLKDAHFDELRGKLTYFIQSPSGSETRSLHDPGNDGKLRLNVSEDPVFLLNEADAQIIPQRAGESLPTPLFLIARDAPDHDVIQIWVAGPDKPLAGPDKPLLPDRKARVTRAANILSVNLQDLSLPGVFKTPLRLRLPDEYNVSGNPNRSFPLVDGKADIAGLLKEIRERRDAKAEEIQTLGMALAPGSDNPKADFATRKYLVIQAARLEDDLRRKDSQASKDLGSDTAPLYQQCGNLIVAIARPAPFSGADKLFEIGKQLSSLPQTAKQGDKDALLSAASASAALARASLSDDIQKEKNSGNAEREIVRLKKSQELYDPTLFRLKELIDSLLPETSQAKTARETLAAQIHEKLKRSRLELDQILAHPLLLLPPNGAPVGTYRLLARTARGDEVLLLKLEVAR